MYLPYILYRNDMSERNKSIESRYGLLRFIGFCELLINDDHIIN